MHTLILCILHVIQLWHEEYAKNIILTKHNFPMTENYFDDFYLPSALKKFHTLKV